MRTPLSTLSLSAYIPAPSPRRSPAKRATMPSPLGSTSNTPARGSAGPLQTLFESAPAPPSPARPLVAASPARRMLEADEREVDDAEEDQPTPPRRLLDLFLGMSKSPASPRAGSPTAALGAGGSLTRRDEREDTPGESLEGLQGCICIIADISAYQTAWTFYEDPEGDAFPLPTANAPIELHPNEEDTEMTEGDVEMLPPANENAPPPPVAPRTLTSRRSRSASSNSLAPPAPTAVHASTLSPRARSASAIPTSISVPEPAGAATGAESPPPPTTPTSPPLFPSLFPSMPSPPLSFSDGSTTSFDQQRPEGGLLPAFGALFSIPKRAKRASGGVVGYGEGEVEVDYEDGPEQKRLRMSVDE